MLDTPSGVRTRCARFGEQRERPSPHIGGRTYTLRICPATRGRQVRARSRRFGASNRLRKRSRANSGTACAELRRVVTPAANA